MRRESSGCAPRPAGPEDALRVLIWSTIVTCTTALAASELPSERPAVALRGILATAVQCTEGKCLAGLPLQPELAFRLRDDHQWVVKFGYASGDAQNSEAPFHIAPWAADLQSDVEDVAGSGRSHVLTAWYKYTARRPRGSTLETSVGIIDATDYLDGNALSNDEYTQFMNSALVNGPNAFLPSYDAGLALQWTGRHWSTSGVYMRVGENSDGQAFHFLGWQLGYRADTALGEGNYRLLLDATDRRFLDPSGTSLEPRGGILLSCDQRLGATVGAFLRLGWQTDAAAIDHGTLYSGGIDLQGRAWNREDDNIGIGYARLGGGNGDLLRSRVWEGYYRFSVNQVFAVTADLQYLSDTRSADENRAGLVLGARLTAEF